MGIVYAAQLRPSKMELLAQWLPRQAWFGGGEEPLVRLGSFRFDDPAGEVGVETQLVGVGGCVYQVPMSYRGAPLDGAEEFLMGTMEHSVLGSRWVYDATADPVYTAELAAAILAAKPQAVEYKEVDGAVQTLPHTATVHSSGTPGVALAGFHFAAPVTDGTVTSITAPGLALRIQRLLDTSAVAAERSLSASWAGQVDPVVIATAIL